MNSPAPHPAVEWFYEKFPFPVRSEREWSDIGKNYFRAMTLLRTAIESERFESVMLSKVGPHLAASLRVKGSPAQLVELELPRGCTPELIEMAAAHVIDHMIRTGTAREGVQAIADFLHQAVDEH